MPRHLDPEMIGGNSPILVFIHDYVTAHSYPPSMREVAEEIGVSLTHAKWLLDRLKGAELVDWEPFKPRTLRLVESGRGGDSPQAGSVALEVAD